MNSQEYIAQAIKTESVPAYLEINQFSLDASLHLLVASTGIADLLKRKLFYGKDIPSADLTIKCDEMIALALLLKGAAAANPDNINNVMATESMAGAELDLGNINVRLLHCALGINSESGELVEALIKQYETGVLDAVNFGEEIGDISWYTAIGFHESGVSEEECRIKNIAKLKARYPDKFTTEAALNRDLKVERAILEAPAVMDVLNQSIKVKSV